MTIEKQLEALRKALEMGAVVHVKLYKNNTLDEARTKASEISKVLDLNPEYKNYQDTQWFMCQTEEYMSDGGIELSSYGPDLPKEESA